MVELAVAAIQNEFGQILACQRAADTVWPLIWQFPHGLVSKGETPEHSLIRTCYECLGMILSVHQMIGEVTYLYQHKTFHGKIFECSVVEDHFSSRELDFKEINDVRWISPDEVDLYRFGPATTETIYKLMAYSTDSNFYTEKWRFLCAN